MASRLRILKMRPRLTPHSLAANVLDGQATTVPSGSIRQTGRDLFCRARPRASRSITATRRAVSAISGQPLPSKILPSGGAGEARQPRSHVPRKPLPSVPEDAADRRPLRQVRGGDEARPLVRRSRSATTPCSAIAISTSTAAAPALTLTVIYGLWLRRPTHNI